MTRPLHRTTPTTDILPAIDALYRRIEDAEAFCEEWKHPAAEQLKALHRQQATELTRLMAHTDVAEPGTRTILGAAVNQTVALLPETAARAALRPVEKRVLSAFDKAIVLDWEDPTRSTLESMKADLINALEEIDLQI